MPTIEDAYNDLRAFLIDAIHTAWDGVTPIPVIAMDDERSRTAPYARVALAGPIDLRQVTPTTDEATMTFAMVGVWHMNEAASGIEITKISKANTLRLGLLASNHPVTGSHMPMVTQVLGDALGEIGDNEFEVLVMYEVKTRIDRA